MFNELMSYIVIMVSLCGFFLTVLALVIVIFVFPVIMDRFTEDD